MTSTEIQPGDMAKNGRSGNWGRVVACDVDPETGTELRLRVRVRIGPAWFAHKPRWWDASSISMTERQNGGKS